MRIGISWNESQQSYYVTIGDGEMKPFRKEEDIAPYCLSILEKLPDEERIYSLVPKSEDLEQITQKIEKQMGERKKQEQNDQ